MIDSRLHAHVPAITSQLSRVILGKPEVMDHLAVALLSGSHVLMEDVPGVGKTTLKALAKLFAGDFKRQFTRTRCRPISSDRRYARGRQSRVQGRADLTNILLADEINRASPRTQSALLEAMSERQVSIEGRRSRAAAIPRHRDQNPIESTGLSAAGSAARSFGMKINLGYPDLDHEVDGPAAPPSSARRSTPILDAATVLELQTVHAVQMDRKLGRYIVEPPPTRAHPSLRVRSPRALLLFRIVRRAFLAGRYAIPEDVKVRGAGAAHRLALDTKPILRHAERRCRPRNPRTGRRRSRAGVSQRSSAGFAASFGGDQRASCRSRRHVLHFRIRLTRAAGICSSPSVFCCPRPRHPRRPGTSCSISAGLYVAVTISDSVPRLRAVLQSAAVARHRRPFAAFRRRRRPGGDDLYLSWIPGATRPRRLHRAARISSGRSRPRAGDLELALARCGRRRSGPRLRRVDPFGLVATAAAPFGSSSSCIRGSTRWTSSRSRLAAAHRAGRRIPLIVHRRRDRVPRHANTGPATRCATYWRSWAGAASR
jgi:MoxR-like ATPase